MARVVDGWDNPTRTGRFRDERGYLKHVADDLILNLSHYLLPLLLGCRQRWEPDRRPSFWRATAMVGLWSVIALHGILTWNSAILLGVLFFCVSPLWAQAVARVSDPVLEYRSYLAVLGWGLVLSQLPEWAVPGRNVLIAWFAIRSVYRSGDLKHPLTYWRVAFEENPMPDEKRIHNYGMALYEQSQQYHDQKNYMQRDIFEALTIQELERVLSVSPRNERARFYRACLLDAQAHRKLVMSGGVREFRIVRGNDGKVYPDFSTVLEAGNSPGPNEQRKFPSESPIRPVQ